jgi:hypothetical protein
VDPATVMAERTMQFSGVAVTAGQRGPGAVPGCGSDNVGGSQGGYDMVPTVEELWDGTVPGHGGEVRVDGAATVWRRSGWQRC